MKKNKRGYIEVITLSVLCLFGLYSFFIIFQLVKGNSDDHLVRLADQFLHKNLWLSIYNVPTGDYVDYYGNIYLYFGPFASIILMPFVWIFGKAFPQVALGITSIVISFFAVYKIARGFEFKKRDSLWLTIFFVFSTVFFSVGIINITAYQVQAFGATLVLVALAEYFGKRRLFIIGIFTALAGLTRFTLYLSFIFFIIEGFFNKWTARQFVSLFIPIFLSVILFGAYNHKRYGSFIETGYKYNITLKTYPMSEQVKFGFLSPAHIPANLYSLLLKGPEPLKGEHGPFILKFPYLKVDPWGIAIWYTSPLFLYLLIKPRKSPYSFSALVATIFLAIPTLLYFGIGFSQFGYRYALDFLPFLFLLLFPSLKPSLPLPAKILIIIGVLFDFIYLTSLWGRYPHFGM